MAETYGYGCNAEPMEVLRFDSSGEGYDIFRTSTCDILVKVSSIISQP